MPAIYSNRKVVIPSDRWTVITRGRADGWGTDMSLDGGTMADMSPSTGIRVGEVVRYPDPPNQTDEHLDGYRNFFNLTAVPGAARLIMNRGIDNPAWVPAPEGPRRPVILIRSNPLRAGTSKTPWEDVFDLDGGRLKYYGDHRVDSVGPPESTRGNAALLAASEAHRANDRASAVPLLIFRSVERNGQAKGYLEFCGLGVINDAALTDQRHPETGESFRNYVYDIALLDLEPEGNQFDWTWINARRDRHATIEQTNTIAPAAWRSWIDTGDTGPVDRRYWPGTPADPDEEAAVSVRPPAWTRDELVLTCAAVHRNKWHEIRKDDERALELSHLLQLMPIHPIEKRGLDFRSPNSIQRKTADLVTSRPGYGGAPTKGGKLTEQVAGEFLQQPDEMLSAADRIKAALVSTDPALLDAIATPDTEEEEHIAVEGRVLERLHRFRERDRRLRQEKLKSVLRAGGALACEVCGFDFAQRFGTHGDGYIEVHHVVPLHETGTSETRLTDLALLCANCHRMSHRRLDETGTWPSPKELRTLIAL
jgi:5-methylcytosine-specific restriction protein A